MKAVGYIRVSTEEQFLEGYSVAAQKNLIQKYCNANNYDLIDLYVEEGVTAKTLNRPRVQELLTDAEQEKFDVVIVYRLDRLTRRLSNLTSLVELFLKHDIELKSLTENLDISSLSGRAMLQILGVFAEFELGSISERVAIAREQRARQGYYDSPGGVFGYDYDKENQTYSINEKEALIVREIFELHQSGKGVDYICRELNSKGVKTRNGKQIYRTFINRMIKKGWYYCGKVHYECKSGEIIYQDAINIPKPILTEEEFLRSNKIYGARVYDQRKKHTDDKYIYKGKLRCAYCGTLFISNTTTHRRTTKTEDSVYRYYRCYQRREGRCPAKYWFAPKVDKAFVDFLKRFASEDIKVVTEIDDANKNKLIKDKTLLENKIAKEKERKRRLQYLLLDEDLDKDEFIKMSAEISDNISNLREEIRKIDDDLESFGKMANKEQEKVIALNIVNEWEKLNRIQKKELLNVFIKNIFIANDGIKRIDFII